MGGPLFDSWPSSKKKKKKKERPQNLPFSAHSLAMLCSADTCLCASLPVKQGSGSASRSLQRSCTSAATSNCPPRGFTLPPPQSAALPASPRGACGVNWEGGTRRAPRQLSLTRRSRPPGTLEEPRSAPAARPSEATGGCGLVRRAPPHGQGRCGAGLRSRRQLRLYPRGRS